MAADTPASGSPTPLAQKLGIKPGATVSLVGAPRDFSVPDLPDGARLRRGRPGGADVVLLFVRQAVALAEVAHIATGLGPTSALWVCWPRRAAGHQSDVSDELVRAAGLAAGVVDVKVAAVGEDWSGLRFVRRVADR
jgi:hypothetical protein